MKFNFLRNIGFICVFIVGIFFVEFSINLAIDSDRLIYKWLLFDVALPTFLIYYVISYFYYFMNTYIEVIIFVCFITFIIGVIILRFIFNNEDFATLNSFSDPNYKLTDSYNDLNFFVSYIVNIVLAICTGITLAMPMLFINRKVSTLAFRIP